MCKGKISKTLIILVIIAGCSTIHFHKTLREASSTLGQDKKDGLVPTPQALKLVSLGFDQVIADYYWLQFISYVGDSRARKFDGYEKADRYLELITGLDPQFIQAYWFATFTVSGEENKPWRAAAIIDRGIEANPDNWYLPFIAGFNQLIYERDDEKAAKYYRMAARFPAAPAWLERQARIIETHAPRLVKEGYSWLSIFNSASEERVRQHAKEQSVRIWVRAFKSAPNDAYKNESRRILNSLGVNIDAIAAMVPPRRRK